MFYKYRHFHQDHYRLLDKIETRLREKPIAVAGVGDVGDVDVDVGAGAGAADFDQEPKRNCGD